MAFCTNCGNQIADDAQFCPACGTKVTKVAEPVQREAAPGPQYQQPPVQPQYQQPQYQQRTAVSENAEKAGTAALVLGILSLVFSESGLVGLILAAIGKGKAKQYKAAMGELRGKAKAGNIMATIGLVFSIISMVGWIIYILIAIIALIANALS